MRLIFVIVLLAFCLSGLASFIGFQEYRIARLTLQNPVDSFETLLYDPPPRSLSLRADKTLFLACHEALIGFIATLQPDDALHQIAEFCQNSAERALHSSPRSSFAHYTLALSGKTLGDRQVLNQHLLASQASGPFESWLAKRRFKLALGAQELLDPDGHAAFEADIASLLQSSKGRIFIANYYMRRPNIRASILDIADRLEESVQLAFVTELGTALNRQAGGS